MQDTGSKDRQQFSLGLAKLALGLAHPLLLAAMAFVPVLVRVLVFAWLGPGVYNSDPASVSSNIRNEDEANNHTASYERIEPNAASLSGCYSKRRRTGTPLPKEGASKMD